VSRAFLSRRVLVSVGIATVFVGGVVLAGAVFRHHDPPPRRPPVATTTTR
jgi:hypothetical protein